MDNKNRMTDTLIFKGLLILLGALTTYLIWTAQVWLTNSCAKDMELDNAVKGLENRIIVLETIIPEIRDSLKDIKQELKKKH